MFHSPPIERRHQSSANEESNEEHTPLRNATHCLLHTHATHCLRQMQHKHGRTHMDSPEPSAFRLPVLGRGAWQKSDPARC